LPEEIPMDEKARALEVALAGLKDALDAEGMSPIGGVTTLSRRARWALNDLALHLAGKESHELHLIARELLAWLDDLSITPQVKAAAAGVRGVL
jgi:hypothetical protein